MVVGGKRSAPPPGTRMELAFEAAMRSPSTEAGRRMAAAVDGRFPLGMPTKAGTVAAQAAGFKAAWPDCLVLVRVGEAYESFGCDAVLVTEHGGVPSGRDLRATARRPLDPLLARLVGGGWRVAVYEETAVLVTPRQRVLAQIVSDANPSYHGCGGGADGGEEGEGADARPVAGVLERTDGSFDVALVHLAERTHRRYVQVDAALAEALLQTAADPIACLRAVPRLCRRLPQSKCILGASAEAGLTERLLDHVARANGLNEAEMAAFRAVPAASGGCAPVARFTLVQLGLAEGTGTPSLAAAACSPRAPAAVRRQLAAWLACPPPHADHVQRAVAQSVRRPDLPRITPCRPGRWRAALEAGDGTALDGLRAQAEELLALPAEGDALRALFGPAARGAGLPDPGAADVAGAAAALRACCEVRSDALAALAARTAAARAEVDRLAARLLPQQYSRDARGVTLLHGAPCRPDHLPVCDRGGRLVPERHTTAEVQAADDALLRAQAEEEAAREAERMRRVRGARAAHSALACAVEAWANQAATVVDHVRAVGGRWTEATPSADAETRCEGMRPYWLPDGVRNEVRLRPGTPLVLTGPNGGGKSTLLRSVAACALLAQCGLLVPCERATVAAYSHVFLRCGADDCAAERKSSFAAEMVDLTTMLSATDGSIVLLDEPCRGTSTRDGVDLLEAILEYVPPATTAMLTTHFFELRAPTCEWKKLECAVGPDAACRPSFRMVDGRCEESMALRVALAAGLPVDIVRRATRPDDTELLLRTAMAALGTTAYEMQPGRLPGARLCLYVLLLQDGSVYVGESGDLPSRLEAHARTKAVAKSFVCPCPSKTAARQMEARLIRELQYCNLPILSVTDGAHRE